jgi:hypothetical protein
MVIVDTTVWLDYFNGIRTLQTDWLDIQLVTRSLNAATKFLTVLKTCDSVPPILSEEMGNAWPKARTGCVETQR